MDSNRIKTYIVVFFGIFICLLFITWQQIEIFRMGYRLTQLKEKIKLEEIKKQRLLETASESGSLNYIEIRAKEFFCMGIPGFEDCRVLEVSRSEFFSPESEERKSLLVFLSELFATSEAEAK